MKVGLCNAYLSVIHGRIAAKAIRTLNQLYYTRYICRVFNTAVEITRFSYVGGNAIVGWKTLIDNADNVFFARNAKTTKGL